MKRVPFGESPGGKTAETFDQKLANAENLVEYLKSKGLPTEHTRLGHYVRFYRRFVAGECTDDEVRDQLYFVMREMDEWSWIYRGVVNSEPEGLLDRLKQAVKGVAFAKDEGENTKARNIQLELRVASYFLQAGFDVNLSGPSDLLSPA